jgi:hypothetical protein
MVVSTMNDLPGYSIDEVYGHAAVTAMAFVISELV